MTEKELPKPRVFRVSHPRLRKIRNGFRKVFQLAAAEMWRALMEEKPQLREGGLAPEDKERYDFLTEMAHYVERCYLNSVINHGGGNVGGPKTDVSGDRVRIFSVKQFGSEESPIYVLKKHFLTLNDYERQKEWHQGNYDYFAPIFKRERERFVPYLDYHYKGFTPKWEVEE